MNHLYTTFRLSKPTPKSWASVFGYKPVNERAAMELGGMYAILSMGTSVDFSLEHIGGMVFDELQSAYYADEEGSASMQRFEQTLHAVKLKIEKILDKEDKISASGLDLQMSVVVFRDSVLYAAVIGEAHIFVQRDNQLNEISGVLADPDMDGFMRSGSLRLTKGDRVLLSTDNVDSDNNFELIEKDLADVTLESLNVSVGAALLIGYHAEPKPMAVVAEVEPEMETVVESDFENESADIDFTNSTPDLDSEDTMDVEEEVMPAKANRIKIPNLFGRRETKAELSETDLEMSETFTDSRETDVDSDMHYDESEDMFDSESQDFEEEGNFGKKQSQRKVANSSKISAAMGVVSKKAASVGKSAVNRIKAVNWKGIANTTKDKTVDIFNNLTGRAPANRGVNPRLPNGNMRRARSSYDPNRRRIVWAAVIIVGLVVVFGIRQTAIDNERRANITALEQQINTLSVDATQLSLDAQTAAASSQPEVKQEVVNAANLLIRDVRAIAANELATPSVKSKATEVEESAQKAADQALKIEPQAQAQVVNNLAANFPGATPSDIEIIDNRIYVSDSARNVIYRMDAQLGSQAAAVLSDLNQPYLLTTDTTNNLIVVDKNNDSVVGVMNPANNSFRRISGLSMAAQGEIAAVDVWTNRALYAVSAARQAISRQTAVGQNYQSPNYSSPWRSDAEFANAIDMHVDFQIYVLIEGQGLKRYVNGQPDAINLRGILPSDETALNNASAFIITATKLYIADSANQRVLVFTKDSTNNQNFDYATQYVYRGETGAFSGIKDIVLNANETQMFVLSNTSVFRIDL